MTKRWLSLVLVLTLMSSLFTGVAFAEVTENVTFTKASDLSLAVGDVVYQHPIGTIKVNNNAIGTANWTYLQNKFTATGGFADAISCTLDQQGNLLASFTVTSATEASFAISATLADPYTNSFSAIGPQVKIAKAPVTSVAIRKIDSSAMVDVTTHEIDAKVETDLALYVGALPATAANVVIDQDSVKVGNSDIVTAAVSDPASDLSGKSNADGLTKKIVLTGKKPGTTTLTVTAKNGISKTINVKVKESEMDSFTLKYYIGEQIDDNEIKDEEGKKLQVGETSSPKITPTPAYATQKEMRYVSSAADVASVHPTTGVVTAHKAGNAIITATPVEGEAAAQTFTVYTVVRVGAATTAAVATVKGGATELSGKTGLTSAEWTETATLELSSPTAGAKIYYTLDGSAASVASTLYTGAIPLSAKPDDIKTFTIAPGYTGTSSASYSAALDKLNFKLRATSATLDKTSENVVGATKITLNATITPELSKLHEANKAFTWTSTEESVVDSAGITISDNKLSATVTPKAKGSTVIQFTEPASGKVIASCKLTVADSPVTGLTLDKTSVSLPKDEALQLTATATPATAFRANGDVTWMTSNNLVAEVTDGLVTVHASAIEGSTAIITAKIGKIYASCTVTVIGNATKCADPTFSATKSDGTTAVSGTSFDVKGNIVKVATQTTGATVNVVVYKDGNYSTSLSGNAVNSKTVALGDNGTYEISAYASMTGKQTSEVVRATYVVSVPVKSVTIGATVGASGNEFDNKILTLNGLTSQVLGAALEPASGADVGTPDVTWTSSDPSVVAIYNEAKTIDGVSYAAGEAIPLKVGEATITATTTGKAPAKSDSITVKVKKVLVTAIAIESPEANANAGQRLPLTADVDPDNATNKAVEWTIGATSTAGAAVIDGGYIRFLKNGTVNLRATAADGSLQQDDLVITVGVDDGSVLPTTISIDGSDPIDNGNNYDIEVAGKVKLTSGTEAASIKYTTDGTTPSATVGTAYAGEFVLPADCNVIKAVAINDGRLSTVVTVYVTWKIQPSKITLTPSKANVTLGETFTVKVDYEPTNVKSSYKNYDLSSSTNFSGNFQLVSTDTATGTVKLKVKADAALGKTTLKVTSVVTGECDVTIGKVAITGIAIEPEFDGEMTIGSTNTLNAIVSPSNAVQAVIWSSSNTKVATVGNAGLVTAASAGTAVITAKSADDLKTTASYTITVAVDPTTVPAVPTTRPTLTSITKTFSVLEDGSAVIEMAKFDPTEYVAVKYYYQPQFEVIKPDGFEGTLSTRISANGVVSLVIKDASPAASYPFSYKWALVPLPNRVSAGAPGYNAISVTGNTLNVTGKPTAINYINNTPPTYEVPGTTGSVDMGTIGNRADFAATGVALTATVDATRTGDAPKAAVAGFSASVGSDGKVTLNINNVATGVYDVFVTISAEGCADVKTGTVQVTVKEEPIPPTKGIKVASSTTPYETSYKKKSVYVLAIADGTVTFSVPGHPVKGWKSNYPKLLSIDPNGVATLKKGGATRITVTATLEDGTKVTQLVLIRKIASEVKLQYKSGKKWFDFSESSPLTIGIGAKKKVLTRAIVVTPAGGKVFAPKWEFSNPAIAFRGSKGYINGSVVGESIVTYELYNGVKATGLVIVSASKTADLIDELDLDLDVIEELETEEIEEIVEVEDDQEIEDVEVIEEIEETEAE